MVKTEPFRTPGAGYAGDVSSSDAWAELQSHPEAQLIDVRTRAEWNYVGLADLSAADKDALLIEWQVFPTMGVNGDFVAAATKALGETGASKDAPVFLLCRSGVRSKAAATALTTAGYSNAFNVLNGFEGDHDNNGHRGQINGWKASGLPWRQG